MHMAISGPNQAFCKYCRFLYGGPRSWPPYKNRHKSPLPRLPPRRMRGIWGRGRELGVACVQPCGYHTHQASRPRPFRCQPAAIEAWSFPAPCYTAGMSSDNRNLVKQQFGSHAEQYVASTHHSTGESIDRLLALAAPQPHWRALRQAPVRADGPVPPHIGELRSGEIRRREIRAHHRRVAKVRAGEIRADQIQGRSAWRLRAPLG